MTHHNLAGRGYKSRWEAANEEIDNLRKQVKIAADELDRTRQIVDLAGIARHMKVERFTPQQWKQRGHLPPVDFPEIKEPLWYASTIKEHFADHTKRVWYDQPEEELSPAA